MEHKKPLITYDGDLNLFKTLESGLTEGLPEEAIEWKRPYGRPTKKVYVAAKFVKFSEELLKQDNLSLLGQTFFHTYWTECNDLETYRSSVKDSIGLWLFKLQAHHIQDWLIVVVDNTDAKRVNKTKLLSSRTSVLDKIRNEFANKASDKVMSLLDPCRHNGRALESWQALLQKLRQLLLHAYGARLELFEEHMRSQRERRNDPRWQFHAFFSLQEELAAVLESLGLYDESLVQYDELDALFTQFVINSNIGGMPEWMLKFTKPGKVWSGITLERNDKALALHSALNSGDICLLDFRSYLFSQQCRLLLLLCRPWEVAERSLAFLHNCVNELRILEVEMPEGSVNCWLFLSCLEVLRTCEKYSDTTQMETYSLFTASLWSYAREKLYELGVLCGLLPDSTVKSDHLHLVVSLLSGIEDDDETKATAEPSPKAKLRDALNSKDSFLKHYFEISELTMGTFKHIGRLRTARFIGRDLAHLYIKLGQPQKAISFLMDLLHSFRREGWNELMAQTQKELALSYSAMGDERRFFKMCMRVSASSSLPADERKEYFEKAISIKDVLLSSSNADEPLRLRTDHLFCLETLTLVLEDESSVITRGITLQLKLVLTSHLPHAIVCKQVALAVKPLANSNDNETRTDYKIQLSSCHEYTKEGQVDKAGVYCKNIDTLHSHLKRLDSTHGSLHVETLIPVVDYSSSFSLSDVEVVPGSNTLLLSMLVESPGVFTPCQLSLQWDHIHFIETHLPSITFSVIEEMPTLKLLASHDLLAGVEQKVEVQVFTGSHYLKHGQATIALSSHSLLLKDISSEQWSKEVQLPLPDLSPFSTYILPVHLLAQLKPQRDNNTISHKLTLRGSWSNESQIARVDFIPPFLSSHKLHTYHKKKYLQVVVQGLTNTLFSLQKPELKASDSPVPIKLLNPPEEQMEIKLDLTASYLWEICMEGNEDSKPPMKFLFEVEYKRKQFETDAWRPYQCDIKLNDYTTLYWVKARVDPPKGSEFCRAGAMCQMQLWIQQLNQTTPHTSLMYEVVVDQTLWAVCGRTAGVVTVDSSGKYTMSLDAMPLIGGYLPLPTVRLSKYIPGDQNKTTDSSSVGQRAQSVARLEPFDPGQVYSWSRAMQVYVLPATTAIDMPPL